MSKVAEYLEYSIVDLLGNRFGFQVNFQSDKVNEFLKKYKFQSKTTGNFVDSSQFPEFKRSKNTIYLRGKDSSRNLNLDITRFESATAMANEKEALIKTLEEFVVAVKKYHTNKDASKRNDHNDYIENDMPYKANHSTDDKSTYTM